MACRIVRPLRAARGLALLTILALASCGQPTIDVPVGYVTLLDGTRAPVLALRVESRTSTATSNSLRFLRIVYETPSEELDEYLSDEVTPIADSVAHLADSFGVDMIVVTAHKTKSRIGIRSVRTASFVFERYEDSLWLRQPW